MLVLSFSNCATLNQDEVFETTLQDYKKKAVPMEYVMPDSGVDGLCILSAQVPNQSEGEVSL
jgi:hypothetical protein